MSGQTNPSAPRGIRFAPSPTGHFHVGNLRTAWVAHRLAQQLQQPWVLRIEDIDLLRSRPEFEKLQLDDCAALGLVADEVVHQNSLKPRHWNYFARALADAMIYPCVCSRSKVKSELENMASAPHGLPTQYAGTCRDKKMTATPAELTGIGWRWKGIEENGAQDILVARTATLVPDFASFQPAYNWACAVDDAVGNYALLVRAWDLESSLEHQGRISDWLSGRRSPVFHTSLVVDDRGHRLEKRTAGVTLPELLANGWSVEKILACFTRSFSDLAAPTGLNSVPMGEFKRELKVSDLLVPSLKIEHSGP